MKNEYPEEIVWHLAGSSRVVALTGAGISAEVGIPTFRGTDGLWEGVNPEDVATPEAFRKNPQFVWSWYRERRIRMEKVNFGPSHKALAELEPLFPQFTLITQNIDGLHTKAGNKNVIELHGNIWYDRCARCDYKNSYSLELEIPKCRICGGIMRPDVVWFNEQIPQSALNEAIDAALNSDFFIIIGTSALVQPAASLPIIAKENGALVLEINPSQTPLTFIANWSLRQKSIDILPHLTQTIKKILKK